MAIAATCSACGASGSGDDAEDAGTTDGVADSAHDADVVNDAGSDGGADSGPTVDARPDAHDATPFDGGPPACTSGGEIGTSKGLEAPWGTAAVGVCRRALGCPSKWTFAAPDLAQENTGTPNQKLLWRDWYYGWAMEAGTVDDQAHARKDLIDFLSLQKTFGHQAIKADGYDANEVLTASHYEIWSSGMTCARLLAVVFADPPVLDATGEWWRGEAGLYALLGRDGSIDAPGARFFVGMPGGPNQLRDVNWALLRGAALPKPASDPTSTWWDDFYNVSAWTMREILRKGDDLGGARTATAADVPALRDPLYVHTSGDDYVFEFPSMRGALQPLFWVAHIGGTTTYGPVDPGTPSTSSTPAPTLAGATTVVVPGTP